MAAIKNPYAKFADDSVITASRFELTLMLYEGALKFNNQAIAAIQDKDMEKANTLILKVQNIIREFQMTLDHKYEVATNFNLLYDYLHRRLMEANFKKDIEILNEVGDFIREFRDMWKEAMKSSRVAV